MHLCLIDDDSADRFLPLTHFRPVSDLRCGAFTLRERAERLLRPTGVTVIPRPELAGLLAERPAPPPRRNERTITILNARVPVTPVLAAALRKAKPGTAVMIGAERAALTLELRSGTAPSDLAATADTPGAVRHTATIESPVLTRPWDLLTLNETLFESELRLAGGGGTARNATVHRSAVRVRPSAIRIGAGTTVGPLAVLDAARGPVILGANVTIMPGAVVIGPVAVGDGSTVKSRAVIYGPASIGPACKVGGEADSVILQGWCNKQHDGFLGHSILGAWVNLGAGTTTSNLKNTYGAVRVEIGGVRVDTGRQFLGLIAGDHVKTGINTPLDTGTIIGPSSNVYGGAMPPKEVPAFSWGGGAGLTAYDPERALAVAVRAMARRSVAASPAYTGLFHTVYARTSDDRQRLHR
jgi:UDP-N-acetylglucosamine diphosphorylase/glucosamine-1-phosphate N-acetyltransferase